jgi:acyl-homoserine lactone acylase PvdQ
VENVNLKASPPTYLFDGKQVPMTVIREKIPVAGQAPVSFTVLRTIDGPVIFTEPAGRLGLAFSLRFASWKRETGTGCRFAARHSRPLRAAPAPSS